jgi:hypothetical protein
MCCICIMDLSLRELSTGLLYIAILWIIIAVIVFSIAYSVSTTYPRESEPLMISVFTSSVTCLYLIYILTAQDDKRDLMKFILGTFAFVFVITLLSVVFIGSMPPAWKGLLPASVASTFTLFIVCFTAMSTYFTK